MRAVPRTPWRVSHGGRRASPETDVTLLRVATPTRPRAVAGSGRRLDLRDEQSEAAARRQPDQFPLACADYNRNPYFRYRASRSWEASPAIFQRLRRLDHGGAIFEVKPHARWS